MEQKEFVTKLAQYVSFMNDKQQIEEIREVVIRNFASFLKQNKEHLHGSFVEELRYYCLHLVESSQFVYTDFLGIFGYRISADYPENLIAKLNSFQQSELVPFRIRVVGSDCKDLFKAWKTIPELTHINPIVTNDDCQLIVAHLNSAFENPDNIPVYKYQHLSILDVGKKVLEILASTKKIDFRIKICSIGTLEWFKSALKKWNDDSYLSQINPIVVDNNHQLLITEHSPGSGKRGFTKNTIDGYWASKEKFAKEIGEKVKDILESSSNKEKPPVEKTEFRIKVIEEFTVNSPIHQRKLVEWMNSNYPNVNILFVDEDYSLLVVDREDLKIPSDHPKNIRVHVQHFITWSDFAKTIGEKIIDMMIENCR